MSERVRNWIGGSLGYLAVAAVSVVYVLAGLFVFGVTGKDVFTILAEGLAGFVFGVSINANLTLQGILRGKASEQMQATRIEHGKAVGRVAPYIDGLELWCDEQNAEKTRMRRTQILSGAGLRYEDFFDEKGNPISCGADRALSQEKRHALRRALHLRITPLSTAALTGDGERAEDPFDFGETPGQYQRRTGLTGAVSKILMAAVFGYFGVDTVESFNVATLAWRSLYVALILALGIAKLVNAYLFVVDTYRLNIVKKINYLQSYENRAEEYAKRAREEKKHGDLRSGSIQERHTEVDRSKEDGGTAAGRDIAPEAAQISAAADSGAERRHDRDCQDRGEQQLSASPG